MDQDNMLFPGNIKCPLQIRGLEFKTRMSFCVFLQPHSALGIQEGTGDIDNDKMEASDCN